MNLDEQIRRMEKLSKPVALPLKIETFANLQNAIRPILSEEVEAQVQAGMASIRGENLWKQWGFGSRNSVLLSSGPPGTGKTITARWIARSLRKGFLSVSAADFGSGDFGNSNRNIREIFATGEKENLVLLFDECDSVLIDRESIGGDCIWMLPVINEIITRIETYNGIVILSTNHPHKLDKALNRRITFHIHFEKPTKQARKQLWRQKWPKWPLALPLNEIENLAEASLTGAEIETIIKEEARFAIIEQRKPSVQQIKKRIRTFERKNQTEDARASEG